MIKPRLLQSALSATGKLHKVSFSQEAEALLLDICGSKIAVLLGVTVGENPLNYNRAGYAHDVSSTALAAATKEKRKVVRCSHVEKATLVSPSSMMPSAKLVPNTAVSSAQLLVATDNRVSIAAKQGQRNS